MTTVSKHRRGHAKLIHHTCTLHTNLVKEEKYLYYVHTVTALHLWHKSKSYAKVELGYHFI